MKISDEHFKELVQKGISLDLVYVLERIEKGIDLKNLEESKINNMILSLERKGYTLENLLTKEGRELLDSLRVKKGNIKVKRTPKPEDEFEKWWKAYPGTNGFEYRGRSFEGTRALRTRKEDCRVKYEAINKDVSSENLLKALEYEVNQKKEESIKTGQNKMTFMQNSLTYLNQRTFEPYVELLKNSKIVTKKGNSIDI